MLDLSRTDVSPCRAVCAGHTNERNFVGLSVTPDGYIACGSEDNSVYAYTSTLPTPLARHCFSSSEGAADSVRVPCLLPALQTSGMVVIIGGSYLTSSCGVVRLACLMLTFPELWWGRS